MQIFKTRKIVENNGSFYVALPKDWINHHKSLNKNFNKVNIVADDNKCTITPLKPSDISFTS